MHTCSHTHTPGTCTHVHTVWAHSGTRRVVDDPVARPRSHTHTGHVHSPARSPAVSHLHLGGSGSGGTRRPSGKPRSRPQSPGAGACPEDIFPWSLREEGRSDLSPLCRDPRFWGGRRQPLSSPCPHLGLGRPEPRLLRRSLDPVPALERGELLRPGAGARPGFRQAQGHVPPSQPRNQNLPLWQDDRHPALGPEGQAKLASLVNCVQTPTPGHAASWAAALTWGFWRRASERVLNTRVRG